MVIPDLSAPNHSESSTTRTAAPMDRFLAGLFDLLMLVPIASFVPSLHVREARIDYIQGFESNLWHQVILLWILSYIVIQTVFLYFAQSTPGGLIMNTRVRSLSGRLTWNQCLLRSTFSLFSWLFMGLPFLEVVTHPVKRAWHDRVSDTIVIDLKHKSFYQGPGFNVQGVRFLMVIGIFVSLVTAFSFVTGQDELAYLSDSDLSESTDSIVAQALLKKDFSNEKQNEIEERIWNSGRRAEKAIAYFFKLHAEKNADVKEALASQICQWVPSEKPGSLCFLSQYSLKADDKMLQAMSQGLGEVQGLTAKVFLLKELTKNSKYTTALQVYKQIKKQASLSDSFKDSLKIWDVSLFWALRENQLKAKRVPASDDETSAIKEYIQERGLP